VTDLGTVRCRGCGVRNSAYSPACLTCGTLLPAPSPAAIADPAAPAAGPSPDELPAATLSGQRISGVARVFVATLGLVVVLTIADRCGAPEAIAETAASAVLAVVALACAFSARAEVLPLLARFGGCRGLGAAVAGLAVLIAFGAVYFPAVRWLGMELMAVSEPFREAGWPLWSIYVLNSVVPAVFEELTFRGYVMARLGTLLTARETLLVQAALFALLHLGVAIYPSHFFIGLVLGTVRQRTRSLYPGMLVHAGWNAVVIWCEIAGVVFP
jgi:membrane protease YdiL (CAAX protease family)